MPSSDARLTPRNARSTATTKPREPYEESYLKVRAQTIHLLIPDLHFREGRGSAEPTHTLRRDCSILGYWLSPRASSTDASLCTVRTLSFALAIVATYDLHQAHRPVHPRNDCHTDSYLNLASRFFPTSNTHHLAAVIRAWVEDVKDLQLHGSSYVRQRAGVLLGLTQAGAVKRQKITNALDVLHSLVVSSPAYCQATCFAVSMLNSVMTFARILR